jgi:flagellar basal-body rod modification protein FlgD
MATGVSDIANQLSALDPSLTGQQTGAKKKNEQIGKDEFLQLLITQLKNQDPESPADSKEFAVQLAQFTQVEKLISIDQKLGTQNSNISSMAGYLGQQVILSGDTVNVSGGKAGQLQLNLLQDAGSTSVEFLNKDGEVVGEKALGPLAAGKRTVSLDGLSLPDGAYGIKVSSVSARGGGTFTPDVSISGLVTGFIPGPDPKLIVDGREVSVSAVKEVTLPVSATA